VTGAARVVVKVGSSSLTTAAGGIDPDRVRALVDSLVGVRERGADLVLVSSGAIAAGLSPLSLARRPRDLARQQAAASVGQGLLVHRYTEEFARHGQVTGQVLLTLDDVTRRSHYRNAQRTFDKLLELGVVPIVNENDTVADDEIRYGDNDRLAARVAQMISADCLVLLSDVDGLYSADPARDPQARFIPDVHTINAEIERMAGGPASNVGSGGMATKIAAAKIAVAAGCHMAVAIGHELHPLRRIEAGERCTWFHPSVTPATVRKQWIAGALKPAGELHVDEGAAAALGRGKSLLPAGVTKVVGRFKRGDALIVRSPSGKEIARGLSAYSSLDAERLRGRRSSEIETVLGFQGRDEIIHRDDLVITG
jgi:glutamate 5-kinase